MNILRKIKLNLIWNRGILVISLIAVIVILYIPSKYLVGTDPLRATPVSISPINLEIKNNRDLNSVLRVHYPVNNKNSALSLGKELVKKLEGFNEFSSVEVTYYLGTADRDRITRMHDKNDKFNLFFMKPTNLERLNVLEVNYIPLASYHSYGVYLIAISEEPKLDGGYLRGKSLGLRADPLSESGHIYPKRVIQKTISNKHHPHFVNKYSSHGNLREALKNGEVDLISSYWGKKQRDEYPEWKVLKIADVPKGGVWYFELNEHRMEITCEIVEALKNHAAKQDGYWHDMIILSECGKENE